MLGRIVVGRPGGPGTRPVDYFTGQPRDARPAAGARRGPNGAPGSRPHPAAARRPPRQAMLAAGDRSRSPAPPPYRRQRSILHRDAARSSAPGLAGGRAARATASVRSSEGGAGTLAPERARPLAPAKTRCVRGAGSRQASAREGDAHGAVLLLMGWSLLSPAASRAQTPATVILEELTWTEVRDLIRGGVTTIIVPTGGTEQNGPHMAIGKHNVRVKALSAAIARALGGTLVAPVLAYVPEGGLTPPTGHMRYPGTVTVPESVFEGVSRGGGPELRGSRIPGHRLSRRQRRKPGRPNRGRAPPEPGVGRRPHRARTRSTPTTRRARRAAGRSCAAVASVTRRSGATRARWIPP